ncbi:MAG: hypothetical protein LBK99_24345 [Opitutaceae bacterium]|jgi:hypothetical protein|nr:hypothetical protein [Opitutaceae bacterium]
MKPAPRHPSSIVSLLTAAAAVFAASIASADIVKQTASAASGQSWETATLWEGGAAASSGNDYFTNGYTLRTPTVSGGNGATTFPAGASLAVSSGDGSTRGTLTLKTKTTTIGELRIGVGTVHNNVNTGSNQPATLNVTNLTILSAATAANPAILQGAATNNDLTVKITNLLGDGYLQFTNPRNYSLSATNAAAFTGEINLNQGTLTLATDFVASGAAFSMSASGASLVLTRNLSVSSFTFGATRLDVVGNTYTSAQLNALFGTTAFSGDGIVSLQSIPEPSILVFVFGAVALCVCGGIARTKRRHTHPM